MSTPMLSKFYYNGMIRRYVIAFGALFDHIEVVQFNTDGSENKREVVPIKYGPREKWVVKNEQDPDFQRPYGLQLPRMSFEIIDYRYDSSRQQASQNKLKTPVPGSALSSNNQNYTFTPVPWNFTFALYITSKSNDEASQIVEQILPFFTPDYAVNITVVPAINASISASLLLDDARLTDTWTGSFDDKRLIEWTLTFTLKAQMFGPVRSGVIANTAMVSALGQTITATQTDVNLIAESNPNTHLRQVDMLEKIKRESSADYGFSDVSNVEET